MKDIHTNEELKQYFRFFIANTDANHWTWEWYEKLQKWTEILQKIKTETFNNEEKSLKECIYNGSNAELKTVDNFLEQYLFKRSNGIASIGQGNLSNNDREKIKTLADLEKLIRSILNEKNILEAEKKITTLFQNANIENNYPAVKYRFLAALFPDEMTTIASQNKFYRLEKALNKKLSVKIEGVNPIEKHTWLMEQLSDIYEVDKQEVNRYHKQIFYWELYEMLDNELNLKKAVVYYGAPGTGKTYKAKKEAKKFIDRWALKTFTKVKNPMIETMQFHPSISYEDFIEGIRPTKDKELELKDGVFKSFCKTVGKIEYQLWKNAEFRKIAQDKNFEDITVSDIQNIDAIKDIFPELDKYSGGLTLQDIIEPAFFIIDEINRADLSRVFGELMYALEYRGYEGKIKTQYSYLVEKETDSGVYFWENEQNYFFIPHNVYIIGTMNTIDRSVDSFDFALRRRFSWEEIEPKYEVIKTELKKYGENISKSFESLNVAIKKHEFLGNDYQIGHAYALNIKNKEFENVKEAKKFLWREFIKPLMQEYLRGLGDSKTSDNLLDEFSEKFGIK